jgi:predicted AlkP superfamily phosphohydrolase/phosphomutase
VGAVFLSLPIAAFAALALFRWLPYELPIAEATRKGTPFWDHVAEAGYRVTAIDLPVTFPAQAADGVQMTSGLGTPDVRQTWGNWTIYSDENFTKTSTETAGNLRHVEMSGDTGRGMMRGPVNFLAEGRPELDLPMEFTRVAGGLIVEVQGNRFELQEGEWSDWASVSFKFNPLIKMVAMTRFKLLSASEPFRVYQEPLNFDPHHLPPTVNISSPRGYAAELADQYGLRETVGWSIATNPLKDDQIDYDTFLEDLSYTMKQREAVVKGELAKDDWDLFIGVFLSTDRMQHMMYRFVDEGHPNYDAELAAKYADRIPWVYQQMDRIVGDIMAEHVDENTHLMIISDHGFHSFRRGVNINTWLVKNGFMSLKGLDPSANYQNLEDFFDPDGRFFKNVDWSKTQAYCLGLGSMYMNLRGRESRGIINPSEYDKVRDEIIDALLAMEDPNYPDEAVVRAVFKREDIFAGPMLPNAPDLFVGFETKWRVSWQTGAGGIPPDIFEDNMNNWSGDHCSVDPLITGGIFFSNRKLPERPRHIMDLAPTALKAFGIPIPEDLEGSPLSEAIRENP